jgi:hypothetical protein
MVKNCECSIEIPDKKLGYDERNMLGVIYDEVVYALVNGKKMTIDEYARSILKRRPDYDGPWRISVDGKRGYANPDSGAVIQKGLYSAYYFHEKKALVRKTSDGNYFTIDDSGNFIEEHENLKDCYLYLSDFGHAIVKNGTIVLPYDDIDKPPARGALFCAIKDVLRKNLENDLYLDGILEFSMFESHDHGYVDCETGRIISSGWHDTEPFYNGRAVAIKDRRFYVIDTAGSIVEQWENIEPCAILEPIGETIRGLVDGEFVYVLYQNERMTLADYFIDEGKRDRIQFRLREKWGYALKETGRIVLAPRWDFLGYCYKDTELVLVERDGKRGFISPDGSVIIELIYEDSHICFRGGFVPVKLNGKWGLVDRSGKDVIPFEWDEALDFLNMGLGMFVPDPDKWDPELLPFTFIRGEECALVSRNGALTVKPKDSFFVRLDSLSEWHWRFDGQGVSIGVEGQAVLTFAYRHKGKT